MFRACLDTSNPPIVTHKDKKFAYQHVCLSGQIWDNCVFEHCVLEASRYEHFVTTMRNNVMISCRLIGNAWPNDMIASIEATGSWQPVKFH